MNIKNRIICFFKGHTSTVTFATDSYGQAILEVGGQCVRCGCHIHEHEAYKIMRKAWEKEIPQ